MQPETIRELLHRAPFAPFTIHLIGGQTYDVDHPDFASFTSDRSALIVSAAGRLNFIALHRIERLGTSDQLAEK